MEKQPKFVLIFMHMKKNRWAMLKTSSNILCNEQE